MNPEFLRDRDPDFGLMGCRIAAFCPEIIEMQARVILSANMEVLYMKSQGDSLYEHLFPTILIPTISTSHEMIAVKKIIDRIASQVNNPYLICTLISNILIRSLESITPSIQSSVQSLTASTRWAPLLVHLEHVFARRLFWQTKLAHF